MKRSIACGFAALTVAVAAAQNLTLAVQPDLSIASLTTQQKTAESPDIKGAFPVTLVKGLDSKKLKVGDTVVCVTAAALYSGSGLLIPSGTRVIGHIIQAQARSKGDPNSSLAMVFDRFEFSKDNDLAMKGTLQAIAPSLGDRDPNTGPAVSGVTLGSSSARSGADMSPATTPPPMSSVQIAGPVNDTPILLASSQGVLGMKHLELDKDGIITSPGKEVKLDRGTQMMIRVQIEVPVR